jgi:hypothetical protein
MASDIYIFVPAASPVYYYLSGPKTAWQGTGTPWTSQTASPYALAMNDVTGIWTPQVAPAQPIWAGGPPYGFGADLIGRGYGNVIETFPLQIYIRMGFPDDAIQLKNQLWRALNSALTAAPCVLAIRPHGTTRTTYYNIWRADIQETEGFIGEEAGMGVMRCRVTWERSPFGGYLSDGVSQGATSLTDNGSSSANLLTYSTSTDYGDMRDQGQPMEIVFAPDQQTSLIYLATVESATYSTTGAAALSTSSTTGTQTALNAPSLGTLIYHRAKARVMMRFSNNTANVQIRVEMRANSGGTTLYVGKWITPTASVASIIDMGKIPLHLFREGRPATQTMQLYIGYRSTNGASATTTLTYNELLIYYEFCRIDATITPASNPDYLAIYPVRGGTNIPVLPRLTPTVATYTSGNAVYDTAVLRGTAPKWRSGKKLWAAWQRSGGHTTTDTADVTVEYSPLWNTLRGSEGA